MDALGYLEGLIRNKIIQNILAVVPITDELEKNWLI